MSSFPYEAQFVPDYVPGRGMSYSTFLNLKQLDTSNRFGMAQATKEIIGSNEQLAKRGFAVQEGVAREIAVLSFTIMRSSAEARQSSESLTNALYWGFSRLARSLDRMDDSLKELVRLASTPAQTWAYEQFEVARAQYTRGWYQKSLESIQRALYGHQSNVGYETEYRFHLLLGKLHLGSWLGRSPNTSESVVDPQHAEQAFLKAYEYYWGTNADAECAEILLWAARAAFVQENLERAEQHAARSVQLHKSGEGLYFLARILAHQEGKGEEAIKNLLLAFESSSTYWVRAGGVGEFPEPVLSAALYRKKRKLQAIFAPLWAAFGIAIEDMRDFAVEGVSGERVIEEEIAALERKGTQIAETARAEGLLGLEVSIPALKATQGEFASLFDLFRERYESAIRSRMQEDMAHAETNEAAARAAHVEAAAECDGYSEAEQLSVLIFGSGVFLIGIWLSIAQSLLLGGAVAIGALSLFIPYRLEKKRGARALQHLLACKKRLEAATVESARLRGMVQARLGALKKVNWPAFRID